MLAILMHGADDDAQGRMLIPKTCDEFQPGHAWETQIDDGYLQGLPAVESKGFLRRAGGQDQVEIRLCSDHPRKGIQQRQTVFQQGNTNASGFIYGHGKEIKWMILTGEVWIRHLSDHFIG